MPVHQALNSAEADKCRQYRVSQVGSLLPGDEKFYPLVHHFTGMLGAAAFDFINLILHDVSATLLRAYEGTVQSVLGLRRYPLRGTKSHPCFVAWLSHLLFHRTLESPGPPMSCHPPQKHPQTPRNRAK
eukprot:5054613-Amphidinium_carterae.2